MDSLAFTKIEPDELAGLWPHISPQLERMGTNHEKVLAACFVGEAQLFVVEHGFFVVKPVVDDGSDETELHVWAAQGAGTGNLDTYYPLVEQLARTIGAKRVTMRTARKGFERAFSPEWRVRHVEYIREVTA